MTAVLRDYTRDGRITVLVGGRALYADREELRDLSRGALRDVQVVDDRGWWLGVVATDDGGGFRVSLGPRQFALAAPALAALLDGSAPMAALVEMHDSIAVPALAPGRFHA